MDQQHPSGLSVQFGIRFPPSQAPEALGASARRAEEAGFNTIWMVDSPLIDDRFLDPFVDLAVCALNTRRIRLGPAVSNFTLRPLVALAAAILGVHRASGGRAVLGLGIGASSLITMGELGGHQGMYVHHSTKERRGQLREGALLLRRLFAGEEVRLGSREIRLDLPRGLPIYLAGSGPRALELAGEIADGVIIQVGADRAAMEDAIAAVGRGAARAGRDVRDLKLVASVFAVISDDWRDDVNRVRPLASYFYSVTPQILDRAGFSTAKRFPDWVPTPDLTHARDWNEAMAAAATYIPDEVVERFCLVGPPAEACRRIEELAGLGVDEVLLRWCSSAEPPDPLIETMGREIIPRFRR